MPGAFNNKTLAYSYCQRRQDDGDQPNHSGEILKARVIEISPEKADYRASDSY